MAKIRAGRWLPMGEAASMLGVDEATLRHWADTGRVRTFRTPGGHRRFLGDDLAALIRRDVPRVEDLAGLVARRSVKVLAGSPARPLRKRAWFSTLDEGLRTRAREHGRRLFGAVVRYVTDPGARRAVRLELLERAAAYGAELQRARVSPAEAAEAFGHFRRLLIKMVTEPRGRGGLLDETQVRTLLETSDLLDEIFQAMLRAWDAPRPGDARGEAIS
jgi:excisionase family DNA binding protein